MIGRNQNQITYLLSHIYMVHYRSIPHGFINEYLCYLIGYER